MRTNSLSIKTRLAGSFAAILLLMLAAAATGYWGIAKLGVFMVDTLHGDIALAQNAGEMHSAVLELRRYEKDVFINLDDVESVRKYTDKWHDAIGRLRSAAAQADNVAATADVDGMFAEMSGSLAEYEAGFRQVLKQIGAGKIATTQRANEELNQFKQAVRRTEELADSINAIAIKKASAVEHTVDDKRQTVVTMLVALTIAGISAAALMAWAITRAITAPLSKAVTVATSVAAGELGNRVTIDRFDEFGRLLHALNDMDNRLLAMVRDVRGAADRVGSATREIALGNDDLSQRTQEQASSLEQTAASIEEMTAAVQQNASGASQASELARNAFNIAERGGNVVQRVVGAMSEISASSGRMANIVGVIDDIAFQTNLLALNAAVEAARAGEQGRGFAVVATEVRNLAQRSATAAKEIKALINESVDKVKAGAELASNSGKALAEIVTSVKQVSAVVESIATANDQQASGIQQINHAITQLDDMTQRNAAAVEEIASVSKSLQEQAALLTDKAAQFKLNDGGVRRQVLSASIAIESAPAQDPAALAA